MHNFKRNKSINQIIPMGIMAFCLLKFDLNSEFSVFFSSYLKLYTTLPISKLAAFMDMVS